MRVGIGDYVRTKRGLIGKIVNISTFREPCMKYGIEANYLNDTWYIGDDDIKLVKEKPIDLIEEHDILKIEELKGVYTICEVEVFKEPYEDYTFLGVRIDNRPIARKLYELNIKSIVTKEKFSSVEYRIGE